jgi:hypothetical protein
MEIRALRGFPQRLGKHETLSTVPTRRGDGDTFPLVAKFIDQKQKHKKGDILIEVRKGTF